MSADIREEASIELTTTTRLPPLRFFVEPSIDPDYIRYLQNIIGTIPGTEILKVNCAACSLFSIGIIDTKSIYIETLKGQKNIYNKNKRYGRNVYEIFNGMANYYTITGTHKFIPVIFSFARFYDNYDNLNKWFNTLLQFIKNTLRENSGTILQFGKVPALHFVSIVKSNGRLTLFDYQQQYCVEEEFILSTIISQSMPGMFRVQSSSGFSSTLYEGYSYIDSPEMIKDLYIYLYCSNTPLYSGTGTQSMGIQNRLKLYRAIPSMKMTIVERVESMMRQKSSAHAEELLSPQSLTAITNSLILPYGPFEIEPEFLPTNLQDEHSLRILAEHRARYLTGAEKEGRIREYIKRDKEKSVFTFANNLDLDIMWRGVMTWVYTALKEALDTHMDVEEMDMIESMDGLESMDVDA